jgi:hypothetical protein
MDIHSIVITTALTKKRLRAGSTAERVMTVERTSLRCKRAAKLSAWAVVLRTASRRRSIHSCVHSCGWLGPVSNYSAMVHILILYSALATDRIPAQEMARLRGSRRAMQAGHSRWLRHEHSRSPHPPEHHTKTTHILHPKVFPPCPETAPSR